MCHYFSLKLVGWGEIQWFPNGFQMTCNKIIVIHECSILGAGGCVVTFQRIPESPWVTGYHGRVWWGGEVVKILPLTLTSFSQSVPLLSILYIAATQKALFEWENSTARQVWEFLAYRNTLTTYPLAVNCDTGHSWLVWF